MMFDFLRRGASSELVAQDWNHLFERLQDLDLDLMLSIGYLHFPLTLPETIEETD
jgi:hypothetical protein